MKNNHWDQQVPKKPGTCSHQNEKNMKPIKTQHMKRIIFLVVLAFGLVIQLKAQNPTVDYLVVDPSAPTLAQLQAQYNGNPNVFFNDNPKAAPYVIPRIMDGHPSTDLHLFVATQPGSLMFSSVTLTVANADSYAESLANWKNNISGQVVIHSADVFTTAAGAALKAKLEQLTNLTFATQ
jgi:hypothetical protein